MRSVKPLFWLLSHTAGPAHRAIARQLSAGQQPARLCAFVLNSAPRAGQRGTNCGSASKKELPLRPRPAPPSARPPCACERFARSLSAIR